MAADTRTEKLPMLEVCPHLQSPAAPCRYCALIDQLKPLMVDETYALNAAVYTSLADIEGEANGMATYDREVGGLATQAKRAEKHSLQPHQAS